MRAEDCFKTDVVTLSDLSQALSYGRGDNRREWEYLEQASPPEDSLPSVAEQEQEAKGDPVERSSRSPRLSSSFWSSIRNWRNSAASSDQLISSVTNILLGLGYVRRYESNHIRWKAAYRLGSSYQVEIKYLDDIETPTFVAEKPLNWVTATLLSGKTFLHSEVESDEDTNNSPHHLADHDLRIKVSTHRQLSPEESIYQSVFPPPLRHTDEGSNKALFSLDSKGNPIPRDNRVRFVRRMATRFVFDFDSPRATASARSTSDLKDGEYPPRPWIRAALSKTGTYGGDNLKDFHQEFNLSIDADPAPMWQWIHGKLSEEEMVGWLDSVLDHALLVSDALRNSSSSLVRR
jgi:hypothetical protein